MKKIFTLIAAVAMTVAAGAQTIFSFELKEGISSQTADAGLDVDLTEDLADFTGGYNYVSIHNGHGKSAKAMINASGQIDLGGSGGSYIVIRLSKNNKLQEGDKIIITGTNGGGEVSFSESKTGADNVVNGEYTVPAAGNGVQEIYIFRGASKPKITGVKIVREANKVKVPVFSIVDGMVSIASNTEGATIMYGTEKGAENMTFTAPFAVTETTTFYAIAKADGLDDSDEVEFKVVKAYGTLAASFNGKALGDGEPEEVIAQDENNGFKLVDPDTQDEAGKNNLLSYTSAKKSDGTLRPSHYKVKGTLKITAPEGKKIVSVKVYGVANNDTDPITVTVEGMAYTTGFNALPSRASTDDMPCVELAQVDGDPITETTIKFSNQARVYIEIYADDVDAVSSVEAAPAAAVAPVKALVNGQVVIVKDGAVFTVAGAQMK